MYALAELVLKALLTRSATYHVALAPAADAVSAAEAGLAADAGPPPTPGWPARPWPETLAAADAVNGLLNDWDDAAAGRTVQRERGTRPARTGNGAPTWRCSVPGSEPFTVDPSRPAESDTPAHRRWWLAGERATAAVAIQLNPQRPPRVQSLALAIPPAAGSVLARALTAVTEWLNGSADAAWPAALPFAPGTDGGLIARRLRMAADLGRAGDPRRLPGGGRHRVSHGRARRRARDGDPVPAGQRRDRRAPPGRHSAVTYRDDRCPMPPEIPEFSRRTPRESRNRFRYGPVPYR